MFPVVVGRALGVWKVEDGVQLGVKNFGAVEGVQLGCFVVVFQAIRLYLDGRKVIVRSRVVMSSVRTLLVSIDKS
ncbi:hypothetical protein [Pseudomonas sp. CF161]|uniref:hypothetical protein n=1 Tax=Pseudomonas sp. CF161 TaxID=911241 RepID=UPI0012EC1B9C|nr:hypothetical protein [Pseudomonas sp. CF161]